MEAMNDWLFIPIHHNHLSHEFAIRRFCQEGKEYREETAMNNYTHETHELYLSPCSHNIDATSNDPDHEVDELVDSFINVIDDDQDDENKKYDDDNKMQQQKEGNLDCDQFEAEFLMVNDAFDEDVRMEMSSSSSFDHQDVVVVPSPPPHHHHDIVVPAGVEQEVSHGVDQGLHLVHSLLACAEAVGCRDTQLANSTLAQIWASVNPWGDSLQRVSYCFAMGLKSRLSLLQNVNANGALFTCNGDLGVSYLITREQRMEGFQLLYQTTPYIAFGFMAANEAICQAAKGKDSLHVIDLGMQHTLQWPSLIRNLASRPEGPPKLRITGLINEENFLELEASKKALVEEVGLLGVVLEFDTVSEPITPSLLTRENLKLREGEALFVNSIMHLHKFVKESRGSLKAILQAIKKLNPTLLTVVEQDANHNGPFFLGRFIESLHFYSAVFDSLEASLPRNSLQRIKIEQVLLVEEIRNIVACEGADRVERHERADQWRRQLGRAGFQVMGLKCISQARMMLSVYGCDGYTLATEKGCLLLGWKGRHLMLASAWQVHNISSS